MSSVRRSWTLLSLHSSSKFQNAGVSVKRPYMSLRAPTLDPLADSGTATEVSTVDYSITDGSEYNPVVDMEVPSVITIAVDRRVPADDMVIHATTELPPLPPVTDPSFEELLASKLHLCSQLFDFTVKGQDAKQKDEKSKTLLELLSLFENKREALKLNGKLRRAIFRMIERNVLRVDPVFPTAVKTSDYTLNILEASWPHLFTCHQLLTHFVYLFPDAEFVNFGVVRRAFFLTQVPDANERVHFVNFLKAYYDTHPKERLEFLRVVRDKLVLLADDTLVPYCGMPLLLCVMHILTRGVNEMLDEFTSLVKEALLPLLSHRYLPLYYSTYKSAILTILGSVGLPDMKLDVLNAIQAKWPIQSSAKESLFGDLLASVVSLMPSSTFSLFARQFFLFSARLCYSPNYKAVNAMLAIFAREDLKKFVKENLSMSINQLYEPIYWASKHHWCIAIRERAVTVLETLETMAKPDCQRKKTSIKAKEDGKSVLAARKEENDPLRKWMIVAKQACANIKDFDQETLFGEIKEVCVLEPDVSKRDVSRFIPFKREKKLREALRPRQKKTSLSPTRSFYRPKSEQPKGLQVSSSMTRGLSMLAASARH